MEIIITERVALERVLQTRVNGDPTLMFRVYLDLCRSAFESGRDFEVVCHQK